MHIVCTGEEPPKSFTKSIFLVGPTLRKEQKAAGMISWRKEALEILHKRDYDGVVFYPEDRENAPPRSYEDQVEWEHRMMNMSDVLLVWIPRDLGNLPGFTTNTEFGLFAGLGKMVAGAPDGAPKTDYQKYCSKKFHIPWDNTLWGVLDKAMDILGKGELREGGCREVPIHIWRNPTFQSWHQTQVRAGNRLDGATLKWVGRTRNPKIIYAFVLQPSIHVTQEDRNKTNEIVIFRPDISVVVSYLRDRHNILDTKVVLIKEFRSPAKTLDGFIWEFPGGSSFDLSDPLQVAVEEYSEETGLRPASHQLKSHGARQLAGTLSAHRAHLFSYELTSQQLNFFIENRGKPHGTNPDDPTGERAFVEVVTVEQIIRQNLLDWSNLGMLFSVLNINPDRSVSY